MEENLEQTAPEPEKSASVRLTEAREQLGLSQKEVADKLYLTTTFIRHIDDGEFHKIPKPAFIKGYLRSYARAVNLSGDEMVALYEAELEAAEPTPEMRGVTEENVSTSAITGPVLQTGLIGLGALLVVVGIIWWVVSEPEKEAPRITQPTVTYTEPPEPATDFEFVLPPEPQRLGDADSQDAGLVVDELVADELVVDDPDLNDSASNDTTVETLRELPETTDEALADSTVGTPEPGQPLEAEPDPAVSADTGEEDIKLERSSDGTRSYITVDAGGFDQLELRFADECWVEIEDGQLGLIYNDLNRDNDVLTLYGTAPFKVLLGKATGVEMIYNGRPFELEPFISGDQTAKLTVSE